MRTAKELNIPFMTGSWLKWLQKKWPCISKRRKSRRIGLMGFLADYHVPREPNSVTGYGLSLPDSTYVTQTIIIETLARKGPCVIVGRCGNYALRSRNDVIDLFICANMEDRIHRIMERYHFSEKDAINAIHSTDKRRKHYYENYTHQKWGSIDSHQMLLNVSRLGMDRTVEIIKQLYNH